MNEYLPGIVRQDAADLEQWAFEASAALDAASKAAHTTVERYREAGAALIKARTKIPHGQWMTWLETNKINQKAAERAIKIHAASNSTRVSNLTTLNSAIKVLAESEKEEPTVKLCARCQRVGAVKDCGDCHAIRHPPKEYDDGIDRDSLAWKVRQAGEKLMDLAKATTHTRAVNAQDARKALANLSDGLTAIQGFSEAPVRQPEAVECRDCGEPCLWVTTEGHKRLLIDEQPAKFGGKFDLMNGVAVAVKWEKGSELYRPHFMSCLKHRSGEQSFDGDAHD